MLRRAAELDTTPLEEYDRLDESVVRQAAREVGLSDTAVTRAVQEWRTGALAPLPPLPPNRRAGLESTVIVERRLAFQPAEVRRELEAWLRAQWFERRRIAGDESRWVPRSGPVAKARRVLDLRHTLRLDGVNEVRACAAPADGGSRVRVVADLSGTRAELLAGMVAAPALLVGSFTFVVLAATHGVPHALDPLAALPAAASGGAGWLGARSLLQRRCARVQDELDLALDGLFAPRLSRSGLPDWAAGLLPRARPY